MNYIDLFFLIVLGSGALWGFKRGLIRGALNLFAIGAAVWAGMQFSIFLESYVRESGLIPESLVAIASMVLTGILAFYAIRIVGNIISKVVKTVGLGMFDRLGGLVLGVLINVLVLSAFLDYALRFVPQEENSLLEQSEIYPYLHEIGSTLKANFHFIPDSLKTAPDNIL